MPVYEYEHVHDDCEISGFRFSVVQGLDEPPLLYCPGCGLEVRRVVSAVSVVRSPQFSPGKAAERGFTTWRKSGKGQWEKVAGPGVDAIVAPSEEGES